MNAKKPKLLVLLERFFIKSSSKATITSFYLITFFLCIPHLSYAHPPRTIDLQIDSENNLLLVNIKHLSRDHLNHYIRRIEITKNEESPIIKQLRQQINPTSVYMEIPIEVAENDIIKVKVYSREGGIKETQLKITEETLEEAVIHQKRVIDRSKPTSPRDKEKIRAAVPKDMKISKPTIPHDPKKQRPAITRNPSVAKPAVPQDPSKIKAATSRDPSIAKPTTPTDHSKLKPAIPSSNKYK